MARWATAFGLQPHSAASAEDALETLRSQPCDLAIVDVMMPGQDGLWLAEQLHREHPQTAVVIATAYTELLDDERSRRGFADLLIKPFRQERFRIAVERGRSWHRDALADLQWLRQLNLEVRDGVEAIARDVGVRMADGDDEATALSAMARQRTPRTQAHSERVVRFVRAMARELGLDAETADLVETAARFHDIGKAAMPLALLTKPCALTVGEEAIMRRHVDVGADLLASLPSLAAAAPLVRATHEWYGGTGYPRALKGGAIPLGSRMISVADAYDAITQDRAYHHPVESAHAVNELLRCCHTQFDPALVEVFLRILSCH
jgi:putative nucleotidyltransferase with HDIG domain